MDSENANKSKKKKTSNIIQICIGVLAVVLAALIIVMMGIVSSIQGTARVVNYAGLVRGKTQRIIKLEISDQPEDGMIQDIEAFVDGLRNGNGELGLVRLDDGAFQSKMQELEEYFAALHYMKSCVSEKSAMRIQRSLIRASGSLKSVMRRRDWRRRIPRGRHPR